MTEHSRRPMVFTDPQPRELRRPPAVRTVAMDLARVDLNLLVVLDALLQEQNVTRAGRRLCLSQPETSTALARLRKCVVFAQEPS